MVTVSEMLRNDVFILARKIVKAKKKHENFLFIIFQNN